MEIGIVGLPNVGKTSLFKAMTGMEVEVGNYPFTTTRPIRGTAPVPDARLESISGLIPTKKIVPATIELVDIPALVAGAAGGEGLGNAFLENVRQVDALAHVVRCFEDADVSHVSATFDPARDVEAVETELLLADLATLEGAANKARRRTRTGDKEAQKRLDVCDHAATVLEEGRPLRAKSWSDVELAELCNLGMITLRPVLYIVNVGEEDMSDSSRHVAALREWMQAWSVGPDDAVVAVCARLEAELAELKPADRAEMLQGLGLAEPALDRMARALYKLLGLQSFYTAGPKEVRAWTIHAGQTALEAAGVIHSDLMRGFIRCETYHIDDLLEHKTEQAIRQAGKMRSEGKHYIMQDGDICHILFNV